MTTIQVGSYKISKNNPCFLIAEIGNNHQGDINIAKATIDAAINSGVHAVKFQKRNNKTLFTTEMYNKPYDNENSFGKTYGEHREALELNKEQYIELKQYTENKGIVFFATPFDIESVDFLESINVPCYKIASALITDTILIEYIASKKKPIFLSTGTATMTDVNRAYNIIKKYKIPLCLLHCIASYPMDNYRETNLNVITTLKSLYPDTIIGFSSHESGIVLPIAAYMLGARVIEKHFTLNRSMKGGDHKFSLEPAGMTKLKRDLDRVYQSLGSPDKQIQPSELDAKRKLGKALYSNKVLNTGDTINGNDICIKCPASGLPPYRLYDIVGRKLKKTILPETAITEDIIEFEEKEIMNDTELLDD